MKKALALIATAALLTACNNESSTSAPAPAPSAPPASSAPAPAPAPAPTAPSSAAPAPSSSAAASLPAECQAYLDKVSACLTKQSGPAADAMKTSMEQARTSWAAMGADQAQLTSACKAANDAFAAQASAMNC